MNRETKFRGYDGAEWIYSKCIDYEDVSDLYRMRDVSDEWLAVCHVGQYTGTVDKNGIEIFEGDILRLRNGQLTEVFFQSGSFVISKLTTVSLHDKKKANITHLLCNESLDSAIVGNVYENPELLKSE